MPSTGAALFVIVVFVLPGFLTVRLAMGRLPVGQTSDTRSIVFAILFSVMIHLLISPWTIALSPQFVDLYNQTTANASGASLALVGAIIAWLVTLMFVFPVALAEGIAALMRARPLQSFLQRYGASVIDLVPQAWDWSFLSERGGWIVAQLKDGKLIGGVYGPKSFASLSPAKPDIFLERIYNITDRHQFLDPIPSSAGAWIDGSAIEVLHFYRVAESEEKK